MTRLLLKLLEDREEMDFGKLGVVDAAEKPPAAEVELTAETVLVDPGVGVSRLMGRFSFCKLRNFR